MTNAQGSRAEHGRWLRTAAPAFLVSAWLSIVRELLFLTWHPADGHFTDPNLLLWPTFLWWMCLYLCCPCVHVCRIIVTWDLLAQRTWAPVLQASVKLPSTEMTPASPRPAVKQKLKPTHAPGAQHFWSVSGWQVKECGCSLLSALWNPLSLWL